MKTIFLGTPDFSTPSLEELIKTEWIELLAVCTQTDKEAGRGKNIKMPPVKELALKNNLLVIQTEKISKENAAIEKIKSLKPDVLVSCSYGQILNEEILNIALHGVINVHASLLPKYRGAAPINWAILNGEKETGITIMKTELSLDSGPIILQEKCPIEENETSSELYKKLSILGAKVLIKSLELIRDGKAKYISQDHSKATKAPALKKEIGLINWNDSTETIHNKIRGLQPWPSAYTHYEGKTVKIWESRISNQITKLRPEISETLIRTSQLSTLSSEAGTIVEIKDYIKVKTGDGYLDIHKLQPESKNIISTKDWINGTHVEIGEQLT